MNYHIFTERMCRRFQEMFDEEYCVTIQKITKNNSVVKTALAVNRPDMDCSPLLYLDQYYCDYRKGVPEDLILRKMLDQYHAGNTAVLPRTDLFRDAEYLKEHTVCRLVGQADNEALLKEIPYRPFLNLAVIYFLEFQLEGTDQASCLVRNEMLAASGLILPELDQYARLNTEKRYPCKFISMNDMLRELSVIPMLSEESEEWPAMYILTNRENRYGAFWMSDQTRLSEISVTLGESYYILPSSIHECIILRHSISPDEDELFKMVSEINASCVSLEEVLADAVYYYRTQPGELVRIR